MLSLNWKKIVLSIHLLLISAWIGTLTAILVLLFYDPTASISQTIFSIHDSIISNASIAVAITGLIFSTFTQWGFIKFRWIIVKWILILFLAVFIIIFATPAVNGAAALSDIYGNKAFGNPDFTDFRNNAILFSLIELGILCFIVVISVFKPWGKREIKRKPNRKLMITAVSISAVLILLSLVFQHSELEYYRNIQIKNVDLNLIEDGIYSGNASLGFDYEVEVEVKSHSITGITVIKNRGSFYAKLADGIREKILFEGRVNVEAVTGATTTSKALLKAVENALLQRK